MQFGDRPTKHRNVDSMQRTDVQQGLLMPQNPLVKRLVLAVLLKLLVLGLLGWYFLRDLIAPATP
jgi:hypothetical protein